VFLSAYEIVGAFHELKLYLPKEASKVTEWFDDNYVHSRTRTHLCNAIVISIFELFPPNLCLLYDCM
jgi:hypothetical protein